MGTTPHCTNANHLIPFIISLYFLGSSVRSFSPLQGIHPLEEKYFGSQVIKCKDGSKSFSRDRLNDNFCDCLDGTDEPGTSACPRGKFYCRNAGSTPSFVFSSRVNDQICDCCDGSDEYDSGINCPKTCVMGGNLEYSAGNYISRIDMKELNGGLVSEELFQKARGGYPWMCNDLQNRQPADQVQKKALLLKKTPTSLQSVSGSIDLFKSLLQDLPLPRGNFPLYKTFISQADRI